MNRTAPILVLLLLVTGCGPKTKNMPVVYFTDTWELGEVKGCETSPPDDAKPFSRDLFCDSEEYDARIMRLGAMPKDQADHESARLRAIYTNPKTFAITFRGDGVQFAAGVARWKCRKTTEGISCE